MADDSVSDERDEPVRSVPKRWRLIVAGVCALAVMIVAGGVWWYSGDTGQSGPDGQGASETGCDHGSGANSPASEPDAGDVQVSDHGVEYVSSESRAGGTLSFGVEVDNTTELVAKDVDVKVTVLDSQGEPVSERRSGEWQTQDWTLPNIMPQATSGFGGDGEFAYPGDDPLPEGDLQLEVDVAVGEWWEVDNSVHEYAEVEALDVTTNFKDWPGETDIVIEDGKFDEIIRNYVSFRLESDYCGEIKSGVNTVFRDDDGEIIGGTMGGKPIPAEHEDGEMTVPDDYDGTLSGVEAARFTPGENDPALTFPAVAAQDYVAYSIFDDSDPEATQVYLMPSTI